MTRSVWRKRRILKWIGLLLCIMMLAFWVFSVMYVTYYGTPRGPWSIGIAFGRFGFEDSQGKSPGWMCIRMYTTLKALTADLSWTEIAHRRLGLCLPSKGVGGMLFVPVWLLVVAAGFPTAALWWRDRRPKAGFCKVCKYDLTGNVSGTCPECGTAVGRASKTNDATTPTHGA